MVLTRSSPEYYVPIDGLASVLVPKGDVAGIPIRVIEDERAALASGERRTMDFVFPLPNGRKLSPIEILPYQEAIDGKRIRYEVIKETIDNPT